MCERCVIALQKWFPGISPKDGYDLLWTLTGFPIVPHEKVQAQIAFIAQFGKKAVGERIDHIMNLGMLEAKGTSVVWDALSNLENNLFFYDQHSERMRDYENLTAALRTFKTTDVASVKVKEQGAIINIETTANKDIEGATFHIPKELMIDLPTGTREFIIPNTFLLRILPGTTETQFILTHKEHDGSWEKFLELAFAKLKEALPSVLVLEGA